MNNLTANILGVNIDKVTYEEAIQKIEGWIRGSGKHYVVTPNIEIIMLAQKDSSFMKILNEADLAIPDSSRFGWADNQLSEASNIKKIIRWPLFLFPRFGNLYQFPVTTGTDLMDKLIAVSNEKGYRIGLIGGKKGLAEKLAERLKSKFANLIIPFIDSKLQVNLEGEIITDSNHENIRGNNSELKTCELDILFVALGQGKQEKWIKNNLRSSKVKVMIGVGGAFDYLSGEVPRAPKEFQNLGFEWFFRLFIQPWRIKRFAALVKFVFLILISSKK